MGRRYAELDSLRGIAALCVVFYHFYLVVPGVYPALASSPFRIFISGGESVMLFFVLSGFVLSLPFFSDKKIDYLPYLIKRVFRIWVPFAVAISVAILANIFLYTGEIAGLSTWFNKNWATPVTSDLVLNHFLFLGNYDVFAFDAAIWSLIHEMRISIIFPIIMIVVIRYNWKFNISLGVILAIVGGLLHLKFAEPFQAWYKTLPYILMFCAGAVIAKHKENLFKAYKSFSKIQKSVLLLVALTCYTYSYKLPNPILIDWGVMIGASIIIVFALFSKTASKVLTLNPFTFLGKISYSLYLYHLVVLYTLVHIMHSKLSMPLILLMSFITTIIVSAVAWYLIEKPSMKFGKILANKQSLQLGRPPKKVPQNV